ncbi:MAG: phospholipid carrier-dependent glycosyltransferase, partial [Candidatus Eremiobacteraeota bacterium]|nr:phospholipid carrier-dependent glycosyltransferase [Candidatus Eremiobacteraeota bacterium]
MDVQARRLATWTLPLAAVVLLALILRLHGIHNPIIDHPGWRQGDESAIARNFATLQYNPLYPQVDYNGPPPNYVELELQIVPFLTATLYKIFGIHEIFGRLISVFCGLGTVVVLAYFGRWLFSSRLAGLIAALLFAIMPGSIYYGRTITPEGIMLLALTAGLYVATRYLVEDEALSWRGALWSSVLLALAYLAKPVAIIAIAPLAVILIRRILQARTIRWLPLALLFIGPLIVFFAYDRFETVHAEWHWASGITALHVLPSLGRAFTHGSAFAAKWNYFSDALGMLGRTMLGPLCGALLVLGFIFGLRARSAELLWGWLAAAILYTYVVVTVERVDYYLYLWLPLGALAGASFLSRLAMAVQNARSRLLQYAACALGILVLAGATYQNRVEIRPYYRYSKSVYRNATTLDRTLDPGALIVMGHYDPSVLYYINRKGWEEDPYLWTPFDEQSAIRKGARYFV